MNLPTQVVNHNFILCESPTQYHEAPKLPSLKRRHCTNLPMQRAKTTKIESPETQYDISIQSVKLPSYPFQEDYIDYKERLYGPTDTGWCNSPVTLSRKTILTIKKDYMDLPTQGGGTPQILSPGRLYTDYKERLYGPTDTGRWNSLVTISRKTIY